MAEQKTIAAKVIKSGKVETKTIKGKETDIGEAYVKVGFGANEACYTVKGWRWDAKKVLALKKGVTALITGFVTEREYNGEVKREISPDFIHIENLPAAPSDASDAGLNKTQPDYDAMRHKEIDEDAPF